LSPPKISRFRGIKLLTCGSLTFIVLEDSILGLEIIGQNRKTRPRLA
jgi:hypothetical protein